MNTTTDYLHTDRLLRHDVLPCEDESPEVIVTEYIPAPRIGRGLKFALITLAYIVGTVAVIWFADWILTRNGW